MASKNILTIACNQTSLHEFINNGNLLQRESRAGDEVSPDFLKAIHRLPLKRLVSKQGADIIIEIQVHYRLVSVGRISPLCNLIGLYDLYCLPRIYSFFLPFFAAVILVYV